MFTTLSVLNNNFIFTEHSQSQPNNVNRGAAVLDIVSGLALIIIGALIASGYIHCPGAAYAMLIIGAMELSPFLFLPLGSVSLIAKEKIKESCNTNGPPVF